MPLTPPLSFCAFVFLRPLCTSMCLQCNQMNYCTANTPTPSTPIRPQMYSGKRQKNTAVTSRVHFCYCPVVLLHSDGVFLCLYIIYCFECHCVKLLMTKLGINLISSVDQICVGAVQCPLLADMWPGNAGPAILSTCSFCGAQPDVQLHHEHVVTNIYRAEQLWVKHFREEHDSTGGVNKTAENRRNQTRLRRWILHRDGIRGPVQWWDGPVPYDCY